MDDTAILLGQITTQNVSRLTHLVGVVEHTIGEDLSVKAANVLTVEPVQFSDVEDRAACRNVPPIEPGYEGIKVLHFLALSDRRVSQQLKEITQRLRQIALLTEPHQPSSRVLTLRNFGFISITQQGHMSELRRFPSQPLVKQ